MLELVLVLLIAFIIFILVGTFVLEILISILGLFIPKEKARNIVLGVLFVIGVVCTAQMFFGEI